MLTVARSLWREPRAPGAPAVAPADRLLVAAYVVLVVVEAVVRRGAGSPLEVLLALALAPALLWRRTHPLVAVVAGWSVPAVLSVVQLVTGSDVGLDSVFVVLVLVHTLYRWGSGREVVLGSAYVALVVVLGMVAAATGWADVFGGSLLVMLVGALAAVARYRADLWRRQQQEVRNEERVALARELHDTVAHHVSAIAVQAQAGGVVAATQPERAREVLAAIEAEASRTLAEMRSVVRVLREKEPAAYEPPPGVADLAELVSPYGTPVVEVRTDAAAEHLPPPLGPAVYRLVQESVTNAGRHARGATRVLVDVRRDGDTVRVRVSDDGRTDGSTTTEPGFGIRGMTERAHLLGGTLSAGPSPSTGWVVEAVLPVRKTR